MQRHVEFVGLSVLAHADMIITRDEIEDRGSFLRLDIAVDQDAGAVRLADHPQRAGTPAQLQEDLALLRDVEDFRIRPISFQTDIQRMPSRAELEKAWRPT